MDHNEDDLIDALDGMENKLNLTADEKDNDDINDEKIEQEYMKFMQELQGGMGASEEANPLFNQLTSMMGEMLKNINEEAKEAQEPGTEGNMMDQMKSMFEKLENNPQMDELADHLLQQFMEKDILEEPLNEAKKNYAEFLKKNEGKLPEEEFTRFKAQAECIQILIDKLSTEPQNKEELVKTFEKMQEYGQPPDEIFGADSPLTMMNQMGQQSQKAPGQGPSEQDCSIF